VTDGAARLAPVPKEQWSDEAIAGLRAAFGDAGADRLLATGPDAPPVPNVLGTLMHHPRLTAPFLVYNSVLLNAPTLDPRWRELMVLRVAWRTRSEYEWLQHVRMARSCGITAEEIEAIGDGAASEIWPPLDADLLEATDQLVDGYRVADETWGRLAQQLDERQLVELVFVVGTYTCLAMVFRSLGLQLDADLDPTTAPRLPRR
jgi:alkylhydroperoxidase family enzyme